MEMWTCVLLLCAAAVCVTCEQQPSSDEDWLELDTPQGPVRGRRDPEADYLYTFYSIPYATAPTKEHKFKPPQPAPVWKVPYDAIDKHIICPQAKLEQGPLPSYLVEQEDCLIATVYVPDTRKKNLPVVVYVHGGAFVMGYGDMFTAKGLLEKKDMILVTFNYRLGIHGFLCLATEDVPGNAGIKDQVALLRWVQKNIASYGGNPDDVTLAGFSAGSASVDLLMLAKSAEGLFHKVIPESGANIAPWAIQMDPLENAKNQAIKMNFANVDDIDALENFYKTAPFSLITSDTFMDRFDSTVGFTPCIERETSKEPFLIESPLSILQKGSYKKLPVLYGFANMEGLNRFAMYEQWKHVMNEKFSAFLPADLKFETDVEREEVAQRIKKFFFGDKPVGDDTVLGYVDYFSDVFFTHSMLWAAKLHVEAGHKHIYLYEYSFVDENTPVVPYTNVRGADHCAQTRAVMDRIKFIQNDNIDSLEYQNMKTTMQQIWKNFIKTGKPVPEGSSLPAWPAAGADRAPYMSLGQKVELRHEPLLETRYRFWEDIYQKYYREPIPPPIPQTQQRQEL